MREAAKLRRWALAEEKALKMTIDKMQSMGFIDDKLFPKPCVGFPVERINGMFERFLEQFKRECHKEDSFGSAIDIAKALDIRKV